MPAAGALDRPDTLSNLFSGLYLTMTHQIHLGDYVKLDSGQDGHVTDIGWRATTIHMLSNNAIIVPNKTLAEAAE